MSNFRYFEEGKARPCPFCGDTQLDIDEVSDWPGDNHVWRVICTNADCVTRGPAVPKRKGVSESKTKAIEAWNASRDPE